MTILGNHPRVLSGLFLIVTLGPACGLVFLGLQLVDQDRALAAQRLTEVREQTADVSVASLIQTLAVDEQLLAEGSLAPAMDALLVTITADGFSKTTGGILLFEAEAASFPEAAREIFAVGEAEEFVSLRQAAAGVQYRALTKHPNPPVRAAAWMRVGRVERKLNKFDAAIAAYREAAKFSRVNFAGVPADLAARRATCVLLAASNRREELRVTAAALAHDLFAGKWRLDRAQYEAHAAELSHWCSCPRPAAQEALTTAALWLVENAPSHRTAGRQAVGPVTILWRREGDQLRALVAGADFARRRWIEPVATKYGAHLWIGEGAESPRAIFRGAGATGLPWPVSVAVASPESVLSAFATRRRLLLAALALMIILVAGGSYVVVRAVGRELAVARLQADFVSAVSHEFRTPLTALSQAAEGLAENRVPEGRREAYYATLTRATARLQRLVEQLLDFGRMEAGVTPYRLQIIQAGEVAISVVNEFRQEVERLGYSVELAVPKRCAILADRDAIGTALWNLLDNAVKYSGYSRTVWLEVVPEGDSILFRVRDRGLGIDPSEQRLIFRKFVRGEESKIAGIKGTGLGLAMVTHIINGHNGTITLDSAPGEGSTFTVWLPRATEG